MTYFIRLTLAAASALTFTILSAGVAFAPPLPIADYEGNFSPTATLDTTQVEQADQCTLRQFTYEGEQWGYCREQGVDSVDRMVQ